MFRCRVVNKICGSVRKNPSLLWKVPIGSTVIVGGGSWLGWSWLMGMSPIHVLEQSFRSFSTVYTVSRIAIDYKLSFHNAPNFQELYEKSNMSEEEKDQIKKLEDEWNKKWDQVHQRGADRLLWVCKRNAGIFTKAGQHIASLNHILPPQYTRTLSVLQDKVSFIIIIES